MRRLLHHTVCRHDFIPDWHLDLSPSEFSMACELDGFTWSTTLKEPPPKQTSFLFIYDSLLKTDVASLLERVKFASALGIQDISFTDFSFLAYDTDSPYNPNERSLSDEDRRVLCQKLKDFGIRAKDLGIRLSYRPHLGTSLHNLEDIDELVAETNWPLTVDTGHLVYLKMFSLEKWLDSYKERISNLIVQDYNPCAWVSARQNSQSLKSSLSTGVFMAPANLGIKMKSLSPVLSRIQNLILSAERKPDTEALPSLKSAAALIKI